MNPKITIETMATSINNNYMLVECPLCKKSIHSQKQMLHQHGSNGNTDNRIEHRKGHCNKHNTYFIIHITNDTIRS